jgi:hypothetical protein
LRRTSRRYASCLDHPPLWASPSSSRYIDL